MKKFLCGFIAGSVLFGGIGVFAGTTLKDVVIADSTILNVLGNKVNTDIVYAVKVDDPNGYGKNYVSARDLAEALGYEVEWDGSVSTIQVKEKGAVAVESSIKTKVPIPYEVIDGQTLIEVDKAGNYIHTNVSNCTVGIFPHRDNKCLLMYMEDGTTLAELPPCVEVDGKFYITQDTFEKIVYPLAKEKRPAPTEDGRFPALED